MSDERAPIHIVGRAVMYPDGQLELSRWMFGPSNAPSYEIRDGVCYFAGWNVNDLAEIHDTLGEGFILSDGDGSP